MSYSNFDFNRNFEQNSPIIKRLFHCPFLFSACNFADALVAMEKAMKRDKIEVNDRQVCWRLLVFSFGLRSASYSK